jgi:hypothetical protein
MKSLMEADFLRWAEDHGLTVDSRYPQSAILQFRPASDCVRFWCIPDQPQRRPYFYSSVLELARPWDSCFVWRHLGSWPNKDHIDPHRVNDGVEFELLKGIGIPCSTAGVLNFQRDDLNHLISLLLVTSIFGWSVGDDLYVVPDNAQYVLKTDHHGVIHVEFRNEDNVNTWTLKMRERGFPLPDDLPDETFKRPSWMK